VGGRSLVIGLGRWRMLGGVATTRAAERKALNRKGRKGKAAKSAKKRKLPFGFAQGRLSIAFVDTHVSKTAKRGAPASLARVDRV
jgi:hypothetical protein